MIRTYDDLSKTETTVHWTGHLKDALENIN